VNEFSGSEFVFGRLLNEGVDERFIAEAAGSSERVFDKCGAEAPGENAGAGSDDVAHFEVNSETPALYKRQTQVRLSNVLRNFAFRTPSASTGW